MLRSCLFVFGMFCFGIYAPPKEPEPSIKLNYEHFTKEQFTLLKNLPKDCEYPYKHDVKKRMEIVGYAQVILSNRKACERIGSRLAYPIVFREEYLDDNIMPTEYEKICDALDLAKDMYYKGASKEKKEELEIFFYGKSEEIDGADNSCVGNPVNDGCAKS